MQSVKPLVLILVASGLLSCANDAIRMGNEKSGDCGEIPIGVTIDKRQLELVGVALGDFSLGKLTVKDTPEFQKVISEAASNAAATDMLACKAIARAGVRGNPPMVDYFTRMTYFFAGHPTVDQQFQWLDKNPIPKAAPQVQSTPAYKWTTGPVRSSEESSATELARTCKQPIVGLKQPPELVIQLWYGVVKKLKAERLSSEYDLLNLYMLKPRGRYQINDPKDLFQEAHYILKCMEEVGELRLEEPGPTKWHWGVDFPNQKIVFRNP